MTESEKLEVINTWFSNNWNQLEINAHKVCGHSIVAIDKWKDDLMVYTFESFRRMNLDKQYEIITEGKPEYYLTRAMAIALKSSTSPFYNQYRKFSTKSSEISESNTKELFYTEYSDESEHNIEAVNEAMKKLDYYDRYMLTEYYYQDKSTNDINKTTTITPATISRDIKKALRRLKVLLDGKLKL